MKFLTIMLGLILSSHASAAGTTLLCNDQNSHSVFRLQISNDLDSAQLTALIGDSSVIGSGTKKLSIIEAESTNEMAIYAGQTTKDVELTISLNAVKAANLKKLEILEVNVDYASGNTSLLCSKN